MTSSNRHSKITLSLSLLLFWLVCAMQVRTVMHRASSTLFFACFFPCITARTLPQPAFRRIFGGIPPRDKNPRPSRPTRMLPGHPFVCRPNPPEAFARRCAQKWPIGTGFPHTADRTDGGPQRNSPGAVRRSTCPG